MKSIYNPFLRFGFQKLSDTPAPGNMIIGTTLTKSGVVKALCGTKTLIETDEILTIPQNFDYNTFSLTIDGQVNCDGNINIF